MDIDQRLDKLYLIAVMYDLGNRRPAGQMMTEYECLRCEIMHGWPNTNTPNICPTCAKEIMELEKFKKRKWK